MPYDPFSDMWEDACNLIERTERLRRQFFQRAPSSGWQPPIDIVETPNALNILVAMPGVAPPQVQVILDTGVLLIRGVPTPPEFEERGNIRCLEIPRGQYERHIVLPPGHYELSCQEMQNGFLILMLDKLK